MKSDPINELATALAKAQGEIEAAAKNASNPHFRARYADLTAVWDACREPLSKNGLSVVQTVHRDGGEFSLITMLLHASGQWIQSDMRLLLSKPDMQGLGSALTYSRRYSLAAIVGISQDDDDGEAATSRAPSPLRMRPPVKPQGDGPNEAQLARLFTIANKCFWKKEDVKAYLSNVFHIDSTRELTRTQYDDLCKVMETETPASAFTQDEPGSRG